MRTLVAQLLLIVVLAFSAAAEDVVYRYPTDSARAEAKLASLVADGYLGAVLLRYDTTAIVRAGDRLRLTGYVVNDSGESEIPGRVWCTEKSIDGIVDGIVADLQAQGRYLARARVARLERVGRNVRLHVTAAPGPLVKVSRLQIEGLVRTNEAQVRRVLPDIEAQPLDGQTIDLVTAQAAAIDYLAFEAPVGVLLRPGYSEADLVVRFRERRQASFFGGGGYSPDDGAGLVWNANLSLANLFGGGRKVRVRSSRPDKRRTTLSIDYSQPIFWLGVDRLQFAVATRDYRDDFYEFGLTSAYSTTLSPGFDISLKPGWRRVEPSNDKSGYSAFSIGLAVNRNRIVQPRNPVGGYLLESDLSYINRRYSKDTLALSPDRRSYNETRAMLHLESFVALPGPVVGKTSLTYQGYESAQELPPLAELFLIGGPGSLRGYRTEQFAAWQAVIVTLEPRYRFDNGFLFVFYDAAYVNRPIVSGDGTRTEELYRSSVGVGLGLVWPSQAITLSLGWGKDSPVDQPRLAVEFLSDL